jgi:hypothetical protein
LPFVLARERKGSRLPTLRYKGDPKEKDVVANRSSLGRDVDRHGLRSFPTILPGMGSGQRSPGQPPEKHVVPSSSVRGVSAEGKMLRTLTRIPSRTPRRGQLLRAEFLMHPSSRGLDDPGVGDDLPDLVRRGLAAHVLVLDRLLQARALAEPMDHVLDHPLYPRWPAGPVAEYSSPGLLPKRTLLLQHRILLRSWDHASSRAA